jgi:DNA-binding protein H-NS
MDTELNQLSESELKNMIADAEKLLRAKEESKRKEVIAQIRQLAASIDATVEIKDGRRTARRGMKVPPKYQDPNDPSRQWTGRGMQPAWVRDLIAQGYSLKDFEIKS